MLKSRIIPCLLISGGGLVKTIGFSNKIYLGDPINAVKIFSEKEVDELMVLDIDASTQEKEPNYKLIEYMANECKMPLCYGGGIKTEAQASRIINLGVEKIALGAIAAQQPQIISSIAARVGTQSVVAVIDAKKTSENRREAHILNGKHNTGFSVLELALTFEKYGAGELVINDINNDGKMQGYDLALIDSIKQQISIPMTILGGASSEENILEVIKRYNIIGVSAGSLFVFKGPLKAVLLNYPSKERKSYLVNTSSALTKETSMHV